MSQSRSSRSTRFSSEEDEPDYTNCTFEDGRSLPLYLPRRHRRMKRCVMRCYQGWSASVARLRASQHGLGHGAVRARAAKHPVLGAC